MRSDSGQLAFEQSARRTGRNPEVFFDILEQGFGIGTRAALYLYREP
jgi:hypothetical protein